MKLFSVDVVEVIQKCLLIKIEEGVNQLLDVYYVQVNNFKMFFDFVDGLVIYWNFWDRDYFIYSYFFVFYQFVLFQFVIQNLLQYNVFEGKYSFVGECFMLGVFQQVVIYIGNYEVG